MTTRPDAPAPPTTRPSPPRPRLPERGIRVTGRRSLALYGGPCALVSPPREHRRPIRLRSIYRIARYALRGRSTVVKGDCLTELEDRFTHLTDTRYALCMNSGTATLHSAFFAVGVRPGDEVIVPTYTFYASAGPVLQLGGTPVFCDIDPRTLTADPDDVEKRITPRTRAICVVHVWGNPARMDRFAEIAEKHNVALVEDCSHAHGASYHGRPVGSWGDIGCFSLQGAKPVSGGELGVAVTDNPTLYDHMLALGHCGRVAADQKADTFDVDAASLGLKYRPHTYAVLLGLDSVDRLDDLNRLRRRNYAVLSEAIGGCPALRPIGTYPGARRGGLLEFIFRFKPDHANGASAGLFAKAAAAEGVPIQRDRYTLLGKRGRLLHELPIFTELDYATCGGCLGGGRNRYRDTPSQRPRLPVAESIADQLVSLPPFTDVDEREVRAVGRAMRKVANNLAKISDYRVGA